MNWSMNVLSVSHRHVRGGAPRCPTRVAPHRNAVPAPLFGLLVSAVVGIARGRKLRCLVRDGVDEGALAFVDAAARGRPGRASARHTRPWTPRPLFPPRSRSRRDQWRSTPSTCPGKNGSLAKASQETGRATILVSARHGDAGSGRVVRGNGRRGQLSCAYVSIVIEQQVA